MQRIAVFALTLVLTAVAAVPQANADSYPSRPIRLIIGFPPGSAADITARLVGDAMTRTLGQQLVLTPQLRQAIHLLQLSAFVHKFLCFRRQFP